MATEEETTTTITRPRRHLLVFFKRSCFRPCLVPHHPPPEPEREDPGLRLTNSWWILLLVGYTRTHLLTIKGKHFGRWPLEQTISIGLFHSRGFTRLWSERGLGVPTLNMSTKVYAPSRARLEHSQMEATAHWGPQRLAPSPFPSLFNLILLFHLYLSFHLQYPWILHLYWASKRCGARL